MRPDERRAGSGAASWPHEITGDAQWQTTASRAGSRIMALDTDEIDVEQIKWVVLMVLFSQPGQEAAYSRMEDLVFEEGSSVVH